MDLIAADTGEVRDFWRSGGEGQLDGPMFPSTTSMGNESTSKNGFVPVGVHCPVESGAQLSWSASGAGHSVQLFLVDLQQPKCSPVQLYWGLAVNALALH